MQTNLLLKVTPKNRDFPLFISDMGSTFFIISDNKKNDDGLWFKNEKFFKYVIPENKDNTIGNKTLLIDSIQVFYAKKANLIFSFLKDSHGLLVEVKSNKIIPFPENNYNLIFNIDRDFQILEKNIRNIILEYEVKDNKKGSYRMFLSINLSIDYNFENISQKGNDLFLSIKSSIEKMTNEPFLYLFCSYDYDDIKRRNEISSNKLTELKKDQAERASTIFENLKFNSDNKDINKFIPYVSIQSNFLIKNIENKIIGFINQLPGAAFISGIYTFVSLLSFLLITGRYENAREVLLAFLNYQNKTSSSEDFAKIPSEIYSENKIKYDSSKVTPLFIFSLYEYFSYTGDYGLLEQAFELIQSSMDKQFLSKNSVHELDDTLLNIDLESLWLLALLSVKEIIDNIERNKYFAESSKLFKNMINYSSKIEDKIRAIKSSSRILDLEMIDLIKEIHQKSSLFELLKSIDLNDFFNKFPFQEQTESANVNLSYMKSFLSIIEILRSIYHEHIGIIPQIYNRRIYISPEYKYNTSNIKSEVRVGFNDKISVNIKYNKKLSNISFIEVRAEDIEKPLLIIVSVNLNHNQTINTENEKIVFIEIFLNTKSDYFIITFDQLNEKTSKIKEVVTHGKSYIESVKITK